MIDVDEVIEGAVAALLWTSSCNGTAPPEVCDHLGRGEDCDASLLTLNYDGDDLAAEARAEVEQDVRDFVQANADDLEGLDAGDIGHDFVLSRNREGTGFWDRGLGERGDRLHQAATVYGAQYAYVGDDGKVYVDG